MSNQASLGDISSSSEPSEEDNEDHEEFFDGIQLVDIGPNEWSPEKLSQACNVQSGLSWSKDQEVDDPKEGDIPVIKIDNVSDGELELDDPLYLRGVSDEQIENNKANKNWIVMIGSNGSQQRIAKCGMIHEDMDFVYASFLFGIKPKTDALNPYFLYYFLNSSKVQNRIQSFTSGSTSLNNLNKSVLEKIVVPSPEKDEQRRIASVLYNVDQAISKTEEIIEQTQRVKKGLMQDLFTGSSSQSKEEHIRIGPKDHSIPKDWDLENLGDLINIQSGNSFESKNYVNEGIPLIRISNIQKGYLDLEDLEYLPENYRNDNQDYLLKKGDIILVMTRPIIGAGIKAARIDHDKEYLLNQRMVKLESSDESKLLNEFLYHYIFSNVFIHQVKISVRATHQPNLSKNDLKSFKIPLPPVEEQKKIIETLNSIENQVEYNKEQKEQLQRLKKGLMQDLLTGSVRTGEDVRVLDEVVEVEG